jgi:hypothetical protein
LSRIFSGFSSRICRVDAAIEQVAALVRFLTPYPPDFNPIELAFSQRKAFLSAMRPRIFEQVCDLIAAELFYQNTGAVGIPQRFSAKLKMSWGSSSLQ